MDPQACFSYLSLHSIVQAAQVWFSVLVFQIDLKCGAEWRCVVHAWGIVSSRSFPSMRFDDSCLQWDAVDTQACFWCLDRFNPLCGECLVFCGGFSNWSTVWGRVKACRPWGIASRCLGQEGSQNPQNFL